MIKGWHKLSLVDYPGHLCAVIFMGGCNFSCFYCHNSHIAFNPETAPDISIKTIFDYLKKRKGTIEGVCVTGGEPTVNPGLIPLITKIKLKGFKVKLDTNGARPDILKECIVRKLIDYIAMDIKGPVSKYRLMTGTDGKSLNMNKIQQSIDIVKNSNIDYEFRTTVVPGFLDKGDILEISRWISWAQKYVLQPYRGELGHLSENTLKEYANGVSEYFDSVQVR